MNAFVMSQARAMLVLLIGILVAGTVLAADQEKMSRSTAGFEKERAEDQRFLVEPTPRHVLTD